MNDLQKLGNNLIEALKPLNDAINQICGVTQKPLFDMPKGLASKNALSDRIIKPASLTSTSLKMSYSWDPFDTVMAFAELEVERLRNEYTSTHADFTEEEFTNWFELQMKERASRP